MSRACLLRARSLLLASLLAGVPAWPQSAPPAAGSPAAGTTSFVNGDNATPATKPDAKRARRAFEVGEATERQGDLRAALEAYDEAVRYAPKKTDYRIRLEAVRFALIQQHTERAERDAVAGHSAAARNELRAAVALDPGYRTAQERLQQLKQQTLHESDGVPAFATEPAALRPPPGTRTLDYRGDLRGAYTEIARQFGLIATFDEDTQTRPVRFRVGEVDFATAMRLLAQQTKTFWRALNERTFFVASDTPEKRKEYLPFIERTIVLPESDRPEQMNEMLRMVREFSGLTHAQLETATRTITMRGSQPDVALAAELIRELEQARGEIMLEVEILEVERNAAQRLGITPPSSTKTVSLTRQQIQLAQQSAEGLVQVLQQLFGTPQGLAGSTAAQIAALLGTGGTTLSALVPPLIAFGGGKTVFLATLPGAAANFADTLSAVRSARRVLLRAKDGEPATFFVGDRFPISLATLSSGGTSGGGATPNVRLETFGTGAGPAAVVAAAFRTNGHLDLATANAGQGANSVSILLGNGSGTFDAKSDITLGTTPVALVAANFGNHDTHGNLEMDLAVVNQGSNTVSILLGNGDGTFQSKTDIPVGMHPSAIVAGQFTASGHLDLAVANQGSSSVSILQGNGDGTFQSAVTTPLTNGRGPAGLAMGHFGDLNLVASPNGASVTANVATIATNTAHGLSVGQSVTLAGVGVAAYNGTFAVTAIVDPTHFSFALVGTPAASGGGTAIINGSADLVTANSATHNVTVLFGNGKGGFTTQTDISVGTQPLAVTTADFNGDSHPDLAVANAGSDTISILLGNTSSSRTNPFPTRTDLTLTAGSQPSAVIAGDFNGDNHVDLAIADTNAGSATVLFGNGDGTFTTSVSFPTGAQPSGLAAGDFNGDNRLDLAVADANASAVTVIINSTGINFNQNAQLPYPSVEFEDIGLKVKATPRIHPGSEVTLHLEIEIRSLAASSFNNIPIISNRSVDETMRLKMNEPNILAGIFSLDHTNTLTGLPGAATISGIGYAAGLHNPQDQQTELIIVVTPRLLRQAPRLDRARYLGPGGEPTGAAPVETNEPNP